MAELLVRVKTSSNRKLDDDEVVNECMERLVENYPEIDGWVFERVDDAHIQILMWGDNFNVDDEIP